MLSLELNKTEMPKVLPIVGAVREGKGQKTVFVKCNDDVKPGQFYMVWIPGLDAKPFAVSYKSKGELGFTSQIVGPFTAEFDRLEKGDKVGLFGPYGNSFTLKENACVVAGGVGMSSVSTLIDFLKNPEIIYGARSKEHLIYTKRFKNKRITYCTDDGSFGRKGFTTEALEEALKNSNNKKSSKKDKNKIKIVYTCGPEVMMKKVAEICEKYKVGCEVSMERHMSCGFGICGKCALNGKFVCVDGPVFNAKELKKLSDFGKEARLKSCRKVPLSEYHAPKAH